MVRRRNKPKEEFSTAASGGHNQESPTADWVRAVAMIATMNKQAKRKSKSQMPEAFSGRDFDFVRVRTLSS